MIKINKKTISSIYSGEKTIEKIYKGTLQVYEGWRSLIANGVPPLTLTKCKGANLVDYKIYGNSVPQSILPGGYQQLEYIEATGTQYFSIDYIANENTNSKGKFQITDKNKANFLFGARQGAVQGRCYGLNWGGSTPYKYYNTYYGNSSDGMSDVNIDTNIHTFEKKAEKLYIDGVLIHTRKDTDGTIKFTTPNNIVVFGCNTNGTIGLLTYARIFNLQFYDGNTLSVDLIPCYRKIDNEIGMYDLVTETFYTNKGTGTFLKGSNAPTPDTPIEVESVGDKTKNLIDKNNVSKGHIDNETGEHKTTSDYNASDFIEIPLNTTSLYLTRQASGNWGAFYDENKQYIKGFTGYRAISVPSNAKYLRITIHTNYLDTMQVEVGNTETEYEPYGYRIPVKVSPPNLLNGDTVTHNYYLSSDGEPVKHTSTSSGKHWCYSDYIEVKENTEYILTTNVYGEAPKICMYNQNKEFIGYTSQQLNFTTIAGTKYIRINVYFPFDGTTLYEIGLEPITTNIYLNEPLRKIGDYSDYIDFENQKVIRNVGNRIFDGTEEWVIHTTTDEGKVFRNENLLTPLIGASLYDTYMSHFAVTDIYSTATFTNGLYRFAYAGAEDDRKISSSRLYVSAEQTTVEDFKNWLVENKPAIMYPLAEPDDAEIVELPNIPLNKGTNIIEIETTIQPSNMEVVYKGKEVK